MIKRIIYGMILIFIAIIVSSNDVFASTSDNIDQTLVCVVGNDYSDLLEYDGYEIISGKVNFNVEGDYYLTYMNQKTKETINKKISVINEKRIKDKPYFEISKTNIFVLRCGILLFCLIYLQISLQKNNLSNYQGLTLEKYCFMLA